MRRWDFFQICLFDVVVVVGLETDAQQINSLNLVHFFVFVCCI
jgi:hypothetical protein